MDYKDKTLLVFGDSIMNGSGNNEYGVGEYLSAMLGFKLKKYTVGGARVGFVNGKSWEVEQLKKVISDGVQPDYIVFDGFTNDCHIEDKPDEPDVPLGEFPVGYNAKPLNEVNKSDDFSTCFDAIICALMKNFPYAKILFVRPHNMGRRDDYLQKQYGARALAICAKWGVPFVDLYSESGLNTFLPEHRDLFTNDSYGWGRGDCTHPNALGYELKYMPLIVAKLKTL